jgi:hypothetical protein
MAQRAYTQNREKISEASLTAPIIDLPRGICEITNGMLAAAIDAIRAIYQKTFFQPLLVV